MPWHSSGRTLDLTRREFDLLAHLVCHRYQVHSCGQLLDAVWATNRDVYEHAVSSHINRLRAKIEPDPGAPRYILTVRGLGYRFGGE